MTAPVKVYENRVCHVLRLPGDAGFRVVRTADEYTVVTVTDVSERGLAQARAFANQVAGPAGSRPSIPPAGPPSGVHPDAGLAGPHPRGA